jgi:Protoglobin
MADRTIQHVDPSSLNDLTPRIAYLKSFLQFTSDDGNAIQSSKSLVAPAVPAILDAVYQHLLSFDITAEHFVPQQSEEKIPDSTAATAKDLHLNHPNIQYRIDFLRTYLVKLVSNSDWSDASPFWTYLD